MAKAAIRHEHEPEVTETVTPAPTEVDPANPAHLEPYPSGDPWIDTIYDESEKFFQAYGFYRETGTSIPPVPEGEATKAAKAKKGK